MFGLFVCVGGGGGEVVDLESVGWGRHIVCLLSVCFV